jgi:uncharacterized membrane protein YfcA
MQIALILLIIFVSTLCQASVGFGLAIISMPLLLLIMDIRTATPLVALVSVVVALGVLATSWKKILWKDAWLLLLATFFGMPLGVFMLLYLSSIQVKTILGITLLCFGLYSTMGFSRPWLQDEKWALPFGFVAGILGSAFNVNGPPTILYGALRGWSPQKFRATLSGYLVPSGIIIIAGHGFAGLWTPLVWRYLLLGLPAAALAFWIGSIINKKIHPEKFADTLNYLMLVMGLVMIFTVR